MKCLCGYEYGIVADDDDNDIQKGDEKFIKLRVVFLRDDGHTLYYPIVTPNALYACPKCGTVRAERD